MCTSHLHLLGTLRQMITAPVCSYKLPRETQLWDHKTQKRSLTRPLLRARLHVSEPNGTRFSRVRNICISIIIIVFQSSPTDMIVIVPSTALCISTSYSKEFWVAFPFLKKTTIQKWKRVVQGRGALEILSRPVVIQSSRRVWYYYIDSSSVWWAFERPESPDWNLSYEGTR